MNGIHDMGGMHGMGPIVYEQNEPTFHEPWEGRAWALSALPLVPPGRRRNFRYGHEILPPAQYLRLSYYARTLTVLINHLLYSKIVTPAELESGRADPAAPKATPLITPAMVDVIARPRAPQQIAGSAPRFRVGQSVRARNMNPVGHTRLPRYTRGKRGTIVRDEDVFNFPDTDADGFSLDVRPKHVYTVRFPARELWGEQASALDTVHVSLWEDYLERG
jgi:nitrile hydratase subunit beta